MLPGGVLKTVTALYNRFWTTGGAGISTKPTASSSHRLCYYTAGFVSAFKPLKKREG